MEFKGAALAALFVISSWLSIPNLPKGENCPWSFDRVWENEGNTQVFEASSEAVPRLCAQNPGGYIQFPTVDQGAHTISLDGKRVFDFGDPSFQSVRSYYGAPTLPCSEIASGKKVVWRAYAYSPYFAMIRFCPYYSAKKPVQNVIAESLNIIAAGTLIFIGLFSLLVFWGKLSVGLNLSLAVSAFSLSLYFLGTVAGLVGISASMLAIHRMTESLLWVGLGLYFNSLRLHGLPGGKLTLYNVPIIGVGLIVIGFSTSGQGIQVGSTIPMFPTIAVGAAMIGWMLRSGVRQGLTRSHFFAFMSLSCFLTLAANDALVATGILRGYMLMSVGVIFGFWFFVLSLNVAINKTYSERDYLRAHLEEEVHEKTKELRNKTVALEKAMDELKETQAELVQSARLASLGTLSAGIAHEINNSLNYVYGSLHPLEKLVEGIQEADRKEKIIKLTRLMQSGLKLTFDIIKSLKSYTGLNQAEFKDVSIREVIDSVFTLIRSKISEKVEISIDVPLDVSVFGSVVGLNQVFMNLVTNALLSMAEGGKLTITSEQVEDRVRISVTDTGEGIPDAIRDRIFEPFFTTREVGKGTGLGLYIVKREIARHKGTLRVESQVGKGTKFVVEIPNAHAMVEEKAA